MFLDQTSSDPNFVQTKNILLDIDTQNPYRYQIAIFAPNIQPIQESIQIQDIIPYWYHTNTNIMKILYRYQFQDFNHTDMYWHLVLVEHKFLRHNNSLDPKFIGSHFCNFSWSKIFLNYNFSDKCFILDTSLIWWMINNVWNV